MDNDDRQGFTLTTEEVVALCDGLGLSPADVLRDDAPGDSGDPGEVIRRVLMARSIVTIQDGKPVVDDVIATAFRLAAQPDLLARVTVEIDGDRGYVHLAADPDTAVERRLVGSGIHRFLVLPGEQVLLRIRELGALDNDVAPPSVEPLTVPLAALAACGERLEAGDQSGAVEALTSAGGGRPSAVAYVAAVAAKQRTYAVTVLYRETETRVRGSLTSWLDAGPAGRWRFTPSDAGSLAEAVNRADPEAMATPVTLSPASADDVLDEILEGLPKDPQGAAS